MTVTISPAVLGFVGGVVFTLAVIVAVAIAVKNKREDG